MSPQPLGPISPWYSLAAGGLRCLAGGQRAGAAERPIRWAAGAKVTFSRYLAYLLRSKRRESVGGPGWCASQSSGALGLLSPSSGGRIHALLVWAWRGVGEQDRAEAEGASFLCLVLLVRSRACVAETQSVRVRAADTWILLATRGPFSARATRKRPLPRTVCEGVPLPSDQEARPPMEAGALQGGSARH